MIALLARYRVKPGNRRAVATALEKMKPLVDRHEDGCALYVVHTSQEAPDEFVSYEQYRDEDALAAHRETPHFKELIEGTVVPLLTDREREILRVID